MQSLIDLFEQQGEPLDVAGHSPLSLADAEDAWLVTAGRIDVFAVPVRDGQPAGARTHLFRAEKGQLLMGLPADTGPDPHALIGVGLPGCKVSRLARAKLRELAEQPDLTAPITALIEGWIDGLSGGVVSGPPPRDVVLLEPGGSMGFNRTTNLIPAGPAVWVVQTEGVSWLFGQSEAPVTPQNGPFPLSGRSWLVAQPGSQVRLRATAELLAESELWPGLDRYHGTILAQVGAASRAAAAAGLDRLERKAVRELMTIEQTLTRLAASARADEADGEETTGRPGQPEDPLVAACRLVGQQLGVPIQGPRSRGEKKFSDPVAAVARASRLRFRRVMLSGEWWRQDNGPLLGFRTAPESAAGDAAAPPVALLLVSSDYQMVDPSTGERTPVTAAVAATIGSFGYTFYRPFEPRSLSAKDVFLFGLIGTWRDVWLLLILGLAGGIVGLLTPLATGWIFDRIIPDAARGELLVVTLALASAAVAVALFGLTQGIVFLRVSTCLEAQIESGLWDRLLSLPVPFFRGYAAGDLADRAGSVAAIRHILGDVVLSSLLTVSFSLVSFALLFYYQATLALLAVALFVVVALITAILGSRQVRYERKDYEVQGRIAGLVLQLVTGITRLRTAGAENRALAVWADEFSQQRRLAYRARRLSNVLQAFLAALVPCSTLLLFAAVSFVGQGMSLGTFVAFYAAFLQVLFAAVSLSMGFTSLLLVVPRYERARPILTTLPEVARNKNDPGEISGEVEVSHLSFRYQSEGPAVLDDVSLHIRPGEFVAFVGPSGAGKSTLFRLLLGFEDPTSGSIYYDREELAGLDLQAVRRQIGVVLQQGKLLPGDIYTNIVGSSLLTLGDAWEAARMSGLARDIEQMPMGMFTVVSEGESTLSGGQRQRLMIARAIARRPRVLFFDEATSALDNATQAVVSESLARLKATRVVVAHRLSTIKNADRIYVLVSGKIVQCGNYDELMSQGGLFGDLVRRQLL